MLLTPVRMLQTISGKGGKTRIPSVVSLVSRGNLGLFLQAHQVPLRSGRHCQGCLPFGNFISCGLGACLHVPIFVLFFYYQIFQKIWLYCPLPLLSPPSRMFENFTHSHPYSQILLQRTLQL